MPVKIEKGQALSVINFTPLIDVVFLLLIFFLVATKFEEEERELDVVLPQASEARPLVSKPRELFVNVDRTGDYVVNGRSFDAEGLETVLRQASTNNPGHQAVIIRADEQTHWKFVVKVMDLCNRASIRDYRVTTAPPD